MLYAGAVCKKKVRSLGGLGSKIRVHWIRGGNEPPGGNAQSKSVNRTIGRDKLCKDLGSEREGEREEFSLRTSDWKKEKLKGDLARA